MAKTYRKIATIQAIQFTGDNLEEIKQFTQGRIFTDVSILEEHVFHIAYPPKDILIPDTKFIKYFIHTLEGDMEFTPGCWIASGGNSDFWAIQNAIFVKTYEEVQ